MKNGKKKDKKKQKIILHTWNRNLRTTSISFSNENKDWNKINKIIKEYLDKGYVVTLTKVGN